MILAEDPSLSSPLKKRSSSTANHSPQRKQNDTSSSIATAVSIKCELYDAPRRSLRQKGLVPEQTGFPYYSPTRPRRTPQDKSRSAEDEADRTIEGASEGMTTEGEKSDQEHEMNKDGVTVTEIGSQRTARRTSGRSQRLRSRSSNASESFDPRRDESPPREKNKPELSSSSASSSAATDAAKEVRILNNAHARRQIIRPWEDSNCTDKGVPLQIPTLDQFHMTTQKKPLQNGSITPSTFARSENIQNDNHIAHYCEDEANDSTPNPVQTAAEALVEISQLTSSSSDSQDQTIESMELETKKSSLKDNSAVTVSSAARADISVPPADVHIHVPGPKEVIIDRKRQLSLFNHVTEATENSSVEQMDRLHSTFEHIVFRHRLSLDKRQLIEVNNFV